MIRRIRGLALAVASGLALAGCGGDPAAPPNVLLITIDTLRADHLGIYGFEHNTSPNIDALARRGVVFERAIAASASTAPSHAAIMTSRYTREHSIGPNNGYSTLVDEIRIAELFQEAGYATAAFVGNLILRPTIGLDPGFDVYDAELPNAERNRTFVFERIAERTNERALAWLAEPRDAPFFLWVHFQDPHGPYDPPDELKERFQIAPEPDEKDLPVVSAFGGWNSIPSNIAIEGLSRPSQYRGRYAGEIFYADRALGALLEAVESHPSQRETVTLLTADHGEAMGEGDRYFSHNFASTPQLAHVPMILAAPGLAPGRRAEATSHVDVMPTLLELAGLEAPGKMSGLALGPYVRENRPLPERVVYCDVGSELSAYSGNTFVRVLGLLGAWDAETTDFSPAWLTFTWEDARSWSLVETDEASKEPIQQYFSTAVPIARTGEKPTQELIRRLQALGYAEPEETPPQ